MKNRIISVILTLAIVLGMLPLYVFAENTGKEHWAKASVDELNEIYGDGTFTANDVRLTVGEVNAIFQALDTSVTLPGNAEDTAVWGEVCTALADIFEVKVVPNDQTFEDYLYNNGFIDGVPYEERFADSDPVTDSQLAVLVRNFRVKDWFFVTINDRTVVGRGLQEYETDENGELVPVKIEGVRFDEESKTLTLTNANLGSMRVHGHGQLNIVLEGDSVIENDGSYLQNDGIPETPVMFGELDVIFRGDGSLSVFSSGEERTFVMDFGTFTFTDNVTLNIIEEQAAYGAFEIVSGGLLVEENAKLNVNGNINISATSHTPAKTEHIFSGGTVTARSMTVGTQSDVHAPTVIVEGDAELNLTGTNIDRDGIEVSGGSVFRQTGGKITAVGAENTLGMRIGSNTLRPKSTVEFLGGSASVYGSKGVDVSYSNLTVNGGNLSVTGLQDTGISIRDAGSFRMMDGTVTSHGTDRPGLDSNSGGEINLMGGEIVLNSTWDIALIAEDGGILKIGEGMSVADADGNNVSSTIDERAEYYRGSTLMIRGEKSLGVYHCELSIPGGIVTQGTAFYVRNDLLLGAESGIVTYRLPSDVTYKESSLTVDGETVEADFNRADNILTIPLTRGGIVRFSIIPENSGPHLLTVEVTGNGETRTETLSVDVEEFNLSLPSVTTRQTISVSGNASPDSIVAFYEDVDSGEPVFLARAKTTSLGTWRETITLSEEGEHRIYAVVTLPDGNTVTSQTYTVTYSPMSDEVTTLSITNYVHGRTEFDPPVAETLVIDYETGSDSASYFSYWPDMPEFFFEVRFKKDASAVDMVEVVTTNRVREETRLSLEYSPEKDAWVGSGEYDETILPYRFRVEYGFEANLEETPDTDMTPDFGGEPVEGEVTDNSDGDFAIGSADFTFTVSADAELTLTDSSGAEVLYTDTTENGIRTIDPEFDRDDLYRAELSDGEFLEYEKDVLYILITGGGFSGNGPKDVDYKYKDNVKVVDESSLANSEPGFIYTTPSGGAWYLNEDGTWEAVGLLDLYEELYFSPENLFLDQATFTPSEEALEQQVRDSGVYNSFVNAVDIWAETVNAASARASNSIKLQVGDSFIETTIGFTSNRDGEEVRASVNASITIKIEVSQGSQKEMVSLTLDRTYDLVPYFNVRIEDGKVETFYNTVHIEETCTTKVSVGVNLGVGDIEEEIQKFFEEEENERRLQLFNKFQNNGNDDDEKDKPIELGKMEIPTSNPCIALYLGLQIGFHTDLSASCVMSGEYTTKRESAYGVSLDTPGNLLNASLRTFKNEYEPETIVSATFHAQFKAECYAQIDVGLTLIKLPMSTKNLLPGLAELLKSLPDPTAEIYIYVKVGIGAITQGHGTVTISSVNGMSKECEWFFSIYLFLEIGVSANLRLTKKWAYELTVPIGRGEYPIYAVGLRWMPTQFNTIEKDPIYVSENINLRELIDLSLKYADFKQQSPLGKLTEAPVLSKVFEDGEESGYSFVLLDAVPGIDVTEDGELTIDTSEAESCQFRVKVCYKGHGENYEIFKVVSFRYTKHTITICKEVASGSRVATFTVQDMNTGDLLGIYTTTESGRLNIAVNPDHVYYVKETACAPGYYPIERTQIVYPDGTITFFNRKLDVEVTPDAPTKPVLDPSGFVYEGIESNRISGVTTTLYYSDSVDQPTANATESQRWNAEDFGQSNPLITNTMGQYLWMVPDGWWQVKFEKDGYTTVYSEWLPVPPVQTDVNASLISTAPASLTISGDIGDAAILLQFDKPMQFSSFNNETLKVYRNDELLEGYLIPVHADRDDHGVLCATAFYYYLGAAQQPITDRDDFRVLCNDVKTYAGTATTVTLMLKDVIKGDIYEDEVVNTHDILLLQQYLTKLAELSGRQLLAADMDNSNVVDMKDIVSLAQTLLTTPMMLSDLEILSDSFRVDVADAVFDAEGYADIPVRFTGCEGIAAFRFLINYDANFMELIDIIPSEALAGERLKDNTSDADRSETVITWYSPANQVLEDTVFTLRFHRKNPDTEGASAVSLTFRENDICTETLDTLSVTIQGGQVKTANYVGIQLSTPSIGSDGAKDTVSCVVTSQETGTPDVTIIAAFYNADDKMLTAWVESGVLKNGETLTLTGTLPIGYKKVKFFLLSKEGYVPLCEASTLSIGG